MIVGLFLTSAPITVFLSGGYPAYLFNPPPSPPQDTVLAAVCQFKRPMNVLRVCWLLKRPSSRAQCHPIWQEQL